MTCTVVVGGFFGDEGKGKIISYLALKDDVEVAARGGVGPNAGHTVSYEGKVYKLRHVPSAFINEQTRLLIGAGVLVNPKVFLSEVEELGVRDRIGLDPQCALIFDEHIQRDVGSEHFRKKIGTTGTGCSPAMEDRVKRVAKLAKEVPELRDFLTDVAKEVNEAIDRGGSVLIEGTQGTFLSLYHGTYPYVTSKDVTAASICADVGVGPKKVDEVIVVFKAYVTRVGPGPLPEELPPGEVERRGWVERGTVTGRLRRAAPFNFELAKRAVMLNSATQIAITKVDALFPEAKGKTSLEELPNEAKKFVEEVEAELKVPVTLVSTGPDVHHIVDLRSSLR